MSLEDGLILFKKNDFKGASEHFYEVVKENGENHKAWNALGVCLSAIGNYSDANTCFSNAIEIKPDIDLYKKNKEKNSKHLKNLENTQNITNGLNIDPNSANDENPQRSVSKNDSSNSNKKDGGINDSGKITPKYEFWLMFVFGLVIFLIPYVNAELIPWYLPVLFRIAVAYLVYDDAKKIGTGNPNAKDSAMKWTPIGWGIIILIVWILFLPLYAYKRNKWCYENGEDLGFKGKKLNSFSGKIIIVAFVIFIAIILVESANTSASLETKAVNSYFNKGVELCESGNYKEGINAFNQAIQLDPNDDDAWCNIGWAYNQLKEYDMSIEASNKAIQINSNNERAWFNKGGALGMLGKNEEAIVALDEALRINPNYIDAKQAREILLNKL